MADFEDTASNRSSSSDIRSRISELDCHILALEDALAAARGEREKLELRLYDFTYPILTLPVEITSEIFISSLPEYPKCPPMTGLTSPALLGQVCRQWRDVALHTPRLWRAVMIDVQFNTERAFSALNTLHNWLIRSADYPLSICLEVHHPIDYLDPRWTDAIIMHAARWEYAKFIVPFDILGWIQGPFPLLRDLTIGPSGLHERPLATTVFHDAPLLTAVHLSPGFNPSTVLLPWRQLARISVAMCLVGQSAIILRNAVSLVEFSGILWTDVNDTGIIPPLLHLQSLILVDKGFTWPGIQKRLLDALTAPALQHLTLSERDLAPNPFPTITSLITRSHCSLETLHVTHSSRRRAEFRAVFPSIKVIQISRDTSQDEDSEEGEE
ncbi:hypothetical protein C8J57DRAFT_499821 [Mycena rebaudengoi]|nr:hypothetical protein C8J57DRAFT_499821 [Mycena rebaudengoi]